MVKIPRPEGDPEILRGDVVEGVLDTPVFDRFATLIMTDGEKQTMFLVAVATDGQPLGVSRVESIDRASAFAAGLMRDAIRIYGSGKKEE